MSNVSSATVADPRVLKAGFAKLQGDDIDFVMRSYEITLGRATSGAPSSKTADVALGTNLNISRQHAKIYYNFDKGRFELMVLGKNGATVSGEPYVPGTPPVGLPSGTLIAICDASFWFLLPKRSALAPPLPAPQNARPVQAAQNGGRTLLPPQPSQPMQPAAAPQPAAALPAASHTSAQIGPAPAAVNPQLVQQQQQQQLQQQLWQQQLLQQQQQRQHAAALAAAAAGSMGQPASAGVSSVAMSQGIALEVTQAQVQAYQAYYQELQRQQLLQQMAAQQQLQAAQQAAQLAAQQQQAPQ